MVDVDLAVLHPIVRVVGMDLQALTVDIVTRGIGGGGTVINYSAQKFLNGKKGIKLLSLFDVLIEKHK